LNKKGLMSINQLLPLNPDTDNINKTWDREAIISGIFLLGINILLISEIIKDEILYTVIAIIINLARIPIALWCSTIAKRKNRNSKHWAGYGFVFPSITLLIIGNLKKSDKPSGEFAQVKDVKVTVSESNNINNLPKVTLPNPTVMIVDALTNDNLTLKYMITNYKRYVKETSALFPLFAAVELNRRGEKFDNEINKVLNKFSTEQGFQSFTHHLESYNCEI
jgi:hypothetical protein